MNKMRHGSTVIALAMLLAGSIPAVPAMAQSANAAVVFKDAGCRGFVPTASGGPGTSIYTSDGAHAVKTSAGTQMLICQFDVPAGLEPATATQAEGFSCGTYAGTTRDSKMIATPGGRATMICKITGQDQ